MGAQQRPPTCTLMAKMIVSNCDLYHKTRHSEFTSWESTRWAPALKVIDRLILLALYRHLLATLSMPTPRSTHWLDTGMYPMLSDSTVQGLTKALRILTAVIN